MGKGNLTIIAALLLSSSSHHVVQAAEAPPTELRFAMPQALRPVEPAMADSREQKMLAQALYEGLTSLSPDDLAVEGAVAKSWTVSADRRSYIFYLRDEARWSNGRRVTAQDFIAGWRRVTAQPELFRDAALLTQTIQNTAALLTPELRARLRQKQSQSDATDKSAQLLSLDVEAIGEGVLKVNLAQPVAHFLHLLTLPVFFPYPSWLPVNEPWPQVAGQQWVGNGAFVLQAMDSEQLVMARNSLYWGRRQQQLDLVTVRFLADPYQVLQELQDGGLHWSGSVDLLPLPASALKQRKRLLQPVLRTYHYISVESPSAARPPAAWRRALSLGLNRSLFQNYVLAGSLRDGVGYFPTGTPSQGPHYLLAFDQQRARRELRSAGFCPPDSPNGDTACVPPPPLLLRHVDNDASRKLALGICDQWRKNLGLDCRSEAGDLAGATDRLVATLRQTAPELPLVLPFMEKWRAMAGREFDLVLSEAAAAYRKPQMLLRLLRRAERLLVREVPVIPLLESRGIGLVRPEVLGFYHNRLDIHPLKYVYFKADSRGMKP